MINMIHINILLPLIIEYVISPLLPISESVAITVNIVVPIEVSDGIVNEYFFLVNSGLIKL